MKKIYLYSFVAGLGLSLMACDGYKEPNPPSQYNPQLPILQLSDVKVTSTLSGSVYNLSDLVETGAKIELATIECDVLGDGYQFGALAYLSNDDFESSFEVPVSSEKVDAQNIWNLYISPAQLSDIYHENISWNNEQASVELKYNLTTTYTTGNGTQTAIVGGSDHFYGPYTVNLIPVEVDNHFNYLYTPGAANNWSQNDSQLLSTTNYVNYSGCAYLSSDGFKFTSADNWDGINYGAGEEEGTLDTDGEAGNLTVEETGLYWCDVNINALTYSLTQITTYGLIGDATEGQWDNSLPMTPSDDYLTWTITTTLGDGGFKFRANDAWDINLGANGDEEPSEAYDDLVQGGKNLLSPGEGTYTITLNLSQLPYSCTVVAQ